MAGRRRVGFEDQGVFVPYDQPGRGDYGGGRVGRGGGDDRRQNGRYNNGTSPGARTGAVVGRSGRRRRTDSRRRRRRKPGRAGDPGRRRPMGDDKEDSPVAGMVYALPDPDVGGGGDLDPMPAAFYDRLWGDSGDGLPGPAMSSDPPQQQHRAGNPSEPRRHTQRIAANLADHEWPRVRGRPYPMDESSSSGPRRPRRRQGHHADRRIPPPTELGGDSFSYSYGFYSDDLATEERSDVFAAYGPRHGAQDARIAASLVPGARFFRPRWRRPDAATLSSSGVTLSSAVDVGHVGGGGDGGARHHRQASPRDDGVLDRSTSYTSAESDWSDDRGIALHRGHTHGGQRHRGEGDDEPLADLDLPFMKYTTERAGQRRTNHVCAAQQRAARSATAGSRPSSPPLALVSRSGKRIKKVRPGDQLLGSITRVLGEPIVMAVGALPPGVAGARNHWKGGPIQRRAGVDGTFGQVSDPPDVVRKRQRRMGRTRPASRRGYDGPSTARVAEDWPQLLRAGSTI